MGPIGVCTKVDMMLNRAFTSSAYYLDKSGLVDFLGAHEFAKTDAILGKGIKYVCGYMPDLCEFVNSYISQTTNEYNDPERMKVFFSHYPAGSSFKAWSYIWVNFMQQKLMEKDMGSTEANQEKYGQPTPPEIDISRV
jgi:hypothetical protein